MIAAELLLVAVILAAYLRGYIPISEVPVLLLAGWLSLRRRLLGWSSIGLRRPLHLTRTILLGTAVGITYGLVSIYALDPLIDRLAGRPTDLSEFAQVQGNAPMLAFWLILSWSLGAVGEELVYRGYIMNRATDLFGRTARGWAIAVVLASSLFGASHAYQGTGGVVSNVFAAVLYSTLYLFSGRNLWLPILAHGMENTVGFALIFAGKYPGL